MLLVEVAQIIWMHNYLTISIGYLYNMVVGKVAFIDFYWMPNPLTSLVSANYTSPNTPVVYQQSTPDMTFLRNAGGFIIVLSIFLVLTLITLALRYQGLSKPLRQFTEKWI